ncbi:MAG: hypothetical protein ABI579_04245 [Candidatus Sumerlaeota bacterium]
MIPFQNPTKLLVVFFLCLAAFSRADKITLSNGRVIEGRVIAREGNRVVVESSGMVSRLSASSVVSVEKVAEHINVLQSSEEAFRRRDVVQGIERLRAAVQQGSDKADAQGVIDRAGPSIKGAIETSREPDKIALRRSLHDLVETDLLTTSTLIRTAQNFRALDDWDTAVELLNRVSPEAIGEDPFTRMWALEFMRTLVRRQLARGDFEGAIACVENFRRRFDA